MMFLDPVFVHFEGGFLQLGFDAFVLLAEMVSLQLVGHVFVELLPLGIDFSR